MVASTTSDPAIIKFMDPKDVLKTEMLMHAVLYGEEIVLYTEYYGYKNPCSFTLVQTEALHGVQKFYTVVCIFGKKDMFVFNGNVNERIANGDINKIVDHCTGGKTFEAFHSCWETPVWKEIVFKKK